MKNVPFSIFVRGSSDSLFEVVSTIVGVRTRHDLRSVRRVDYPLLFYSGPIHHVECRLPIFSVHLEPVMIPVCP